MAWNFMPLKRLNLIALFDDVALKKRRPSCRTWTTMYRVINFSIFPNKWGWMEIWYSTFPRMKKILSHKNWSCLRIWRRSLSGRVGNTEQQNERLDDVGVFVAFNYYKRVAWENWNKREFVWTISSPDYQCNQLWIK